jgi:hypothetical protein
MPILFSAAGSSVPPGPPGPFSLRCPSRCRARYQRAVKAAAHQATRHSNRKARATGPQPARRGRPGRK